MAGLEKNKCADCEGSGVSDEKGPGLPYDCLTCGGTGKKKKVAAEAPPRVVIPPCYVKEEVHGPPKIPQDLRQRRKDSGLTMGEVADKLGVKVSEVSDVERGVKSEGAEGLISRMSDLYVAPRDEGTIQWISKDPENPRYRRVFYVQKEITAPAPAALLSAEAPPAEPLTLAAYSKESRSNALYRGQGSSFGMAYATLGLAGEAGEVAEKIKKVLRDTGGGDLSAEQRKAIALELGDSLWYLDAVAFECGLTLEEIARANLEKLADRRARKVIHGEGDNR